MNLLVKNAIGASQRGSASFTFRPLPTVSAVSPTVGPVVGGTSVTIRGSGFAGATSVMFGAARASSFVVVDDTTITAVAPAHAAGSAHVVVKNAKGASAAVAGDTFVFRAQPIVGGLTPATGPTTGGTAVTISGSGFTGATSVMFGDAPAASFTVGSDSSIVAVAPAARAGSRHVVVTTPKGKSAVTGSDVFAFQAVTAPPSPSRAAAPDATPAVVPSGSRTVQGRRAARHR